MRPLISQDYSTDRNRNRLGDRLEEKFNRVNAQARARTSAERQDARQQLEALVDVEVIFNRQISPDQINAFLRLGGRISYVYRAVSYGWNGRIPLRRISRLPEGLGASLVLVETPRESVLHLDKATQTGRVRIIWSSGFAGNASGIDGSSSITIGIIDTGVDETHLDLTNRMVYWMDFTDDNGGSGYPQPIDMIQHGSHVAAIATGSGAASGTGAGLSFTEVGNLSGVSGFYPCPIDLPSGSMVFNSTAWWVGTAKDIAFHHAYGPKYASSTWYSLNSVSGASPLTLSSSFTADANQHYTPALLGNGKTTISDYVITNVVPSYPGNPDGFNKLRGVAPGCSWAGAKVFRNDGTGYDTWSMAALDALVALRQTHQIKVVNMSLGTIGDPGLDPSERQKVNSTVNNGIVVVVSAGNDGRGSTTAAREIDDPGRAAMALTVGAANDVNQLTDYTSHGFSSLGSDPGQEEDFKPDLLAPGGSIYQTYIMSVDSNSGDGSAFADKQTNDYYNISGTSMASPFAAGGAALVIDALEEHGVTWDFASSQHARLVKMLLCATATESNQIRENTNYNPTLQRASAGPNGYPVSKDSYEGYGLINPEAAVEAVSERSDAGFTLTESLGAGSNDRRAWARFINVTNLQTVIGRLTVPATGDFDLYLYQGTPNTYGTPILLAASAQAGNGVAESLTNTPSGETNVLLVIKRVSGYGSFSVTSAFANTLPVISAIEDQVQNEDTTLGPLAFTVGDEETAAEDLVVTASSSDVNLVPEANIVLAGEGINRTVSIQPLTDQTGQATITIRVTDPGGLFEESDFMLTINPVNDAPSFTKGPDVVVVQNSGAQSFDNGASAIAAGPANESWQTVDFIVSNNFNALFDTQPAVSPTGVLTFTPTPFLRGSATVTLSLHDNGGTDEGGIDTSAPQTITITIGQTTDTDNDGMPDDFEMAYGLNPASGADANVDNDGDGFTNLEEFQMGTSPNAADDVLKVTDLQETVSGNMQLSFASKIGKVYQVERNDDFPSGIWNIVAENITGTGEIIQVTDSGVASLGKAVYRVVVEP